MILISLIVAITIAYAGLIIAFVIGFDIIFRQSKSSKTAAKSVSVVVAFKDEASNLPNLIEALMHQSIPKEHFEVILVNDHSTDDFEHIVAHYSSLCTNLKLLILSDNRRGKKAAIKMGVDSAIFPLIALTDADCLPHSKWLETITLEAEDGFGVMIGPVVMNYSKTLLSRFQSLDYASLMASAMGSCGLGHPVIASSANLAFRNDLLKVSEDDLIPKVSSGDDMFLLHHAKRIKGCFVSFLGNKEAVVKTSTAPSFIKALNQRKRWASKSTSYTDSDTIVVGLIVLLFNMLLVSLLVTSVFKIDFLFFYFGLMIIKTLVEFLLLYRYLKFTEQRELLKVFLPLQLIYPFYICYSFFSSISIKATWKGRPIK
jgi:biofilm PGA synthesis N-glycosyltransferase PgaC